MNLLVVSDPASVNRKEILRVLAPGGAAVTVGADNGPRARNKLVKPWPEEIDEWTHYLHGANGNAVADPNELGMPGCTIYADLDDSGQFEPDEPSAVTDAAGEYVIEVPAGTFTVAEVVPSGFFQTFPSGGVYDNVVVAQGEVVTGFDFGNAPGPPATIRGTPVKVHILFKQTFLGG